MTSKISSFKIAMNDLQHRVWMIALSCLGSLLALPVFFLMTNRFYLDQYQHVLHNELGASPESTYYYSRNTLIALYQFHLLNYAVICCGVILFLGALIVGIWGFRYLYSRKMADLYHSMPIKRDQLFRIVYLNGFLIWFIPMLLSLLLTLLLMFVSLARCDQTAQFALLLPCACKLILVCLLAFLTVYNFCVLCVMLCGNVINTICLTFIGGVGMNVLIGLHVLYSQHYFSFFNGLPIGFEKYSWLSPFVNSVFLLANAEGMAYDGFERNIHIFSFDTWNLCMSLLVIIACFAGALLLHRKRFSELAEHGLDNRPVQHIVRVLSAIISGSACAFLFLYLMDSYTGWMLFGCVLGSVLVFGILDIIFHMDFHAFGKHKLEMLCTVLLTCALLFVYKYDIVGFDKHLPKQSSVTSCLLYTQVMDFEDDGALTPESMDVLYQLLERLTDEEHIDNDYDWEDRVDILNVNLTLKNGLSFQRCYTLLNSDKDLLSVLVESDEFRNTHYPCSSGLLGTPDHMALTRTLLDYSDISTHDLTEEQRTKIMDAFTRDFLKHYSWEHQFGEMIIATIEADYYSNDDIASEYPYSQKTHYYLNVYEDYTETLEVLSELYDGIPLVTKDMDISFVVLHPTLYACDSMDELYTYFGYPGDVDYDADVSTVSEDYDEMYIEGEYSLNINDPDEIARLLPVIHIGGYWDEPFQNNFVYAGRVTLSNGRSYPFYVRKGELDKEWIDRMEFAPYYDN